MFFKNASYLIRIHHMTHGSLGLDDGTSSLIVYVRQCITRPHIAQTIPFTKSTFTLGEVALKSRRSDGTEIVIHSNSKLLEKMNYFL